MNYNQIIERLSQVKTKRNLSSRELSLMLGNSDTYFYKVEDGSFTINLPKFLEILETLDISTEEFFYNDLENYHRDKDLIEKLNLLTKEELNALLLIIKRGR